MFFTATAFLVIAVGFRMTAGAADAGDQPVPEGQTPVDLPADNVHAGNELVLWNASNDEWAEKLRSEVSRLEKMLQSNPGEGYEVGLERARQDLEAVCALPETTVC